MGGQGSSPGVGWAGGHPGREGQQAARSPRLQIRRFGERLVEAAPAHQPVGVLGTLALGRHNGGIAMGERGLAEGGASLMDGRGLPHLELGAATQLQLKALVQGTKNTHGAHVHMDAVSWGWSRGWAGTRYEPGTRLLGSQLGHSLFNLPQRSFPPLHSRRPVDSMREAVLTVSPNRQYRGMVSPTTPATHGPAEMRGVGRRARPELKLQCPVVGQHLGASKTLSCPSSPSGFGVSSTSPTPRPSLHSSAS